MIDFYSEIKPAAEARLKESVTRRNELQQQRAALSEKMKTTEAHISELEARSAELDRQAGPALAKGDSSYGKYLANIQRNVTDLEVSRRELAGLEASLEATIKALPLALRELSDGVKALAREKLPMAQTYIDQLLDECLGVYDQWIDGWMRVCSELGESFSTRADCLPGLRHPRIDGGLPGLIRALPDDELAERLEKIKAKEGNTV